MHNGDCLEIGEMLNPETGLRQSYQELWTSPPDTENEGDERESPFSNVSRAPIHTQPPNVPASRPSLATPRPLKQKVVVAFLHRPPAFSAEPKGMIIRIGDYCEGIIEIPDHRTVQYQSRGVRPRSPNEGVVRAERWIFRTRYDFPAAGDFLGEESHRKGQAEDPAAADTTTGSGDIPAKFLREQAKAGDPAAGGGPPPPPPPPPPLPPLSIPPPPRRPRPEAAGPGGWIRDPQSDYSESQELAIWMPCLWICEKRRRVGDSIEKAGFGGRWRVVEAEGW